MQTVQTQTNNEECLCAQVEEDGRIVLPPELASQYGIRPGVSLQLHDGTDGLYIRRPARLARLYIEATSLCNLNCTACVRKTWDEPMGKMSDAVFDRIIEGLGDFSPAPTVFFGGFGEPLLHPKILDMVSRAKALGAEVELITNATLLTREVSLDLIRVGLDRLWVSIDGATPDSYADIRQGANLPRVLENVAGFHETVRAEAEAECCLLTSKTRLGIAFVAMKRNIADLPEVINIGRRFGADRFVVTNVLPYTEDMMKETLYYQWLGDNGDVHLSLSGIDIDDTTYAAVSQALRNVYGHWAGIRGEWERNQCPFIVKGAGAIRWDGDLSPCLPLMHDYTSYYYGYCNYNERYSRRWAIGNVAEHSLFDLWNDPEHIAFRERVQAFKFSPCTRCGFCDLSLSNREDCFDNTFPTCGGCLWAQGVVQCP